jgi:hypothetical protein
MTEAAPPLHRFLDWMERFRGRDVIFRGVHDEDQMWPIAVRSFLKWRTENLGVTDERTLAAFRRYEADFFADFRREAVLLVEHVPADEWQWLALAQHYGLPTIARLVAQSDRRAVFCSGARYRKQIPALRL